MRNPWRLLLLLNITRSSIHTCRLNSPLHYHQHLQQVTIKPDPQHTHSFSSLTNPNLQTKTLFSFGSSDTRIQKVRFFSSEMVDSNKDHDHVRLADIFLKSNSFDEIKEELKLNNGLVINHGVVLMSLVSLGRNHPDCALKLFNWFLETDSQKLSSKSYNLMLRILEKKTDVLEFWNLIEVMKKKGYGIESGTYDTVKENFEKEEMRNELGKFEEIYSSSKSGEGEVKTMCSRVCKLISGNDWNEEVQKRLIDLNVSWSSDLVEMVLERLGVDPTKALMFFWWVEESPSFKHTKGSYNAMVTVVGREDCVEKFWRIVNEMKGAGYEMEMETYVKVMGRFYKRKMVKDAVDLYAFMMAGSNKPSPQDAFFLLRKITVGKVLDMDLFSKVVGIFTEHDGNRLTKPFLDGILKSLRSVSRMKECGKILKAMEKGGFIANDAVYGDVIFQLGRYGSLDEAYDILDDLEVAGGSSRNSKLWTCLIRGKCEAGDIDTASSCFRKMVEKFGGEGGSCALDAVVNEFCSKNRQLEACKFLSEMVKENELRPWHTTYKLLTEKLLVRGNLDEALSLVPLMKNDGFPPYLDPFILRISKYGTGDDAMSFLKAITVKKIPSTSVFIQMFSAFFKAERPNQAHDCLAKSPAYIRSHADVLNLFFDMKPKDAEDATTAVAA